jgi:hypothetical protein
MVERVPREAEVAAVVQEVLEEIQHQAQLE